MMDTTTAIMLLGISLFSFALAGVMAGALIQIIREDLLFRDQELPGNE